MLLLVYYDRLWRERWAEWGPTAARVTTMPTISPPAGGRKRPRFTSPMNKRRTQKLWSPGVFLALGQTLHGLSSWCHPNLHSCSDPHLEEAPAPCPTRARSPGEQRAAQLTRCLAGAGWEWIMQDTESWCEVGFSSRKGGGGDRLSCGQSSGRVLWLSPGTLLSPRGNRRAEHSDGVGWPRGGMGVLASLPAGCDKRPGHQGRFGRSLGGQVHRMQCQGREEGQRERGHSNIWGDRWGRGSEPIRRSQDAPSRPLQARVGPSNTGSGCGRKGYSAETRQTGPAPPPTASAA